MEKITVIQFSKAATKNFRLGKLMPYVSLWPVTSAIKYCIIDKTKISAYFLEL